MGDTIRVGPDKPCLLANRLMRRLEREKVLGRPAGESPQEFKRRRDRMTEALADEIHQDILDSALRKGG